MTLSVKRMVMSEFLSTYTRKLYIFRHGIPATRVSISFFGRVQHFSRETGVLRTPARDARAVVKK